MAYAENTSVPVDRSKAEIERILERYGATGFGYFTQGNRSMIVFEADGVRVRFILPLPRIEDMQKSPSGRQRTQTSAEDEYNKELRRRWRSLTLAVKAKLEAVDCGISEFRDEFLANIVLPNGLTIGEQIKPQIADSYSTGKMPPLLLG